MISGESLIKSQRTLTKAAVAADDESAFKDEHLLFATITARIMLLNTHDEQAFSNAGNTIRNDIAFPKSFQNFPFLASLFVLPPPAPPPNKT